ncbi:mitochondrial pyruvate carrier 2-like [Stylophora pistillata]|uniref:Mitochondrial pyruvate carrier n=1 Tax=Stylophora pistillata TaxID=50429 RepID=A0A2B4T1S3_STYPI|nr:mitochondrial pyruvate carrier 2-like [Stylophora pistillata]PFX34575.1 Mitochondrial pyruvate carrier 2 [Stylophora pistillata]
MGRMSAAKLVWVRFLGQIEAVLPRRLVPFWKAPAGPQTIFFWAPAFKWGLVFAGIADLARPADKLSPSQSTALAATGLIWARYSLVIIPKNWLLFSVNIGLGITGINQLCRIAYYRYTLEKSKESNENQAKIEQTAN